MKQIIVVRFGALQEITIQDCSVFYSFEELIILLKGHIKQHSEIVPHYSI